MSTFGVVWPSQTALRRLAPGLLLIAAVLLIFRDTGAAMVAIWIRSSTFAHAFLVPPIVVWLVWRQRDVLAVLQPRPEPWLLLPIAATCLLWLLGELIGVNAATQFALVTLLVLSVPAFFGIEVTRALLFPLLFLFFAVPFGEFTVPTLVEWTANFTVLALQWSGVPVFREGNQFVISTGSWSVVEACSGVRYLIASFMVGTLFAYLNFQSARRRALFMLVSLLVPIVANWFRAYLIVMLGHLSSNRLAAGVDHIIYGWVFFGLVIGIMFLVGARWAQVEQLAPRKTAALATDPTSPPEGKVWWVVGGMLLLLLATQGAFWRLDHAAESAAPRFELPASPGVGWTLAPEAVSDWSPSFHNPSLTASRSYGSGAARVGVWVSYYRDQGYERKLVSSTNGLTPTVGPSNWATVGTGELDATMSGAPLTVRTGDLRGSSQPGEANAQRLRVWQIYWINGRFISSDVKARTRLALDRLLGRGDDGAAVFVYTTTSAGDPASAADAILGRFVDSSLPAITARLQATRAAR